MIIQEAQGCRIWIDNEQLIDFSMGGGALIHGHADESINNAVAEQLDKGTHYASPSVPSANYEDYLKKQLSSERIIFCNTGSEAVMRACRLARAKTGHTHIAVLEHGWHGSWDITLQKDRPAGSSYSDSLIVLPQDIRQSSKILNKYRSKLAMVMAEPIQGSNPLDITLLLQHLSYWCFTNQIPFCLDNIITGFRCPNILDHDIAVYGKIAGGGFPIGIVSCTNEMFSPEVFMGGTFSGNPISTTAGYSAVSRINESNLSALNTLMDSFVSNLNYRLCNLRINHVGSVGKLINVGYPQAPYLEVLKRNGININPNRLIFLSFAHSISDLMEATDRFIKADKELSHASIS